MPHKRKHSWPKDWRRWVPLERDADYAEPERNCRICCKRTNNFVHCGFLQPHHRDYPNGRGTETELLDPIQFQKLSGRFLCCFLAEAVNQDGHFREQEQCRCAHRPMRNFAQRTGRERSSFRWQQNAINIKLGKNFCCQRIKTDWSCEVQNEAEKTNIRSNEVLQRESRNSKYD